MLAMRKERIFRRFTSNEQDQVLPGAMEGHKSRYHAQEESVQLHVLETHSRVGDSLVSQQDAN